MNTIPVIDMTATGRNITQLREAAGLSVRQLQQILGFANPQAIYKWQQGSCVPSLDNLVILAAVFRVSMDDIIVLQSRVTGAA